MHSLTLQLPYRLLHVLCLHLQLSLFGSKVFGVSSLAIKLCWMFVVLSDRVWRGLWIHHMQLMLKMPLCHLRWRRWARIQVFPLEMWSWTSLQFHGKSRGRQIFRVLSNFGWLWSTGGTLSAAYPKVWSHCIALQEFSLCWLIYLREGHQWLYANVHTA